MSHKKGCWCPECRAFRRRREQAARDWFARTNQAWPGLDDALELMALARDGIAEWMTIEGHARIAELRRDNPVLLRDLYADALD